MYKITWIAAASMIAAGAAVAADSTVAEQKTGKQPASTTVGSSGESASARLGADGQNAVVVHSGATSGRVVLQSTASAPAFAPLTPFVSLAMRGQIGNDAELATLQQEVRDREQRLLQNPEYRDLLRARHRMAMRYQYADLADWLEISAEQKSALLDLFADQQLREQSLDKPVLSNGGAASVLEFIEKNEERERLNDAEVAHLLGDAKFQEWKDYQRNAMARFQVQRLQQVLPPDAQLRPEQLRSLVGVIGREQRRMMQESANSIPPGAVPDEEWHKRAKDTHVQRLTAANRRILDQSASILSPEQLAHFDSVLQHDLDAQSRQQFFMFGSGGPRQLRD